jgi:hypothetical protein
MVILLLGALLLAGCGQLLSFEQKSVPIEAQGKFIPLLAVSELEVGQNRLPIGILKDGTPINDPDMTLHLRFFYLDGDDKTAVQSETDTVYRGTGLPVGLYVAYPKLDRAGAWSVEVAIPQETGDPQTSRIRLEVLEEGTTPAIGSSALATQNLTMSDVDDLEHLTSDVEPDPDLYQMTIAEALATEQPLVVMFGTPGYCKTAVCAPNMQVLKSLKDEFQAQANFIHVEVYPYPFDVAFEEQRFVAAMQEWNLTTEPWTFLVDSEGVIRAKYEGGLTFDEMEPALRDVIEQ